MTTREIVLRIRDEQPAWIPPIEASLRAADAGRGNGLTDGRFSGSVVVTTYLGGVVPNLHPLVTWGVLERVDQSRKNTYYKFVDEIGVREALADLR